MTTVLMAQPKLTYYLPDIEYNSEISTPESFLDFQIGEWHISHDLLRFYMESLAKESDRISIETYAYTHENRPLQLLTITSPENHQRIEEIRQAHIDLTEGKEVDLSNLPAIVYQGYSIHGNESSGANASALVAYYLAAGQSDKVEETLDNLVILLDPCYNPDGLNRFASWVNSNRYTNLVYDRQSREFNEPWPRGRTNHYLFDLNRDWLLLTHPESRGRIKNFHKWKPNILTDHHEMGTNSTFFFQPGIPSRTNPNTPAKNQELTEDIAVFHAKALDEIGSLYYSKESFDDFYYGKGSTYPDAHGCIGILFEQASSRGHLQESINGVLSFPFTIRNQVTTSLSTQTAAINLREELLTFKKQFYDGLRDKAKRNPVKAYVFTDDEPKKLDIFVDKLLQHDIKVSRLDNDYKASGQHYAANQSYAVELDQKQYTLAKTIFESVTTFQDSLFYDVSAWTMPLAFDLSYDELDAKQLSSLSLSDYSGELLEVEMQTLGIAKFAYLIPWNQYGSEKVLYQLLSESLKIKVLNEDVSAADSGLDKDVVQGSLIVPIHNQRSDAEEIHNMMRDCGLKVYALNSGSLGNVNIGSPSLRSLELPRVALISGQGMSSYDVGELWHHMDVNLEMPFTMLDMKEFNSANLDKYNLILMADGRYPKSHFNADKLSKWIKDGGTVIAFKSAIDFLINNKLIDAEKHGHAFNFSEVQEYGRIRSSSGAQRIGGSIFEATITEGHPLAYGYDNDKIALMKRGSRAYKLADSPLAVPLSYTDQALLSGYSSDENLSSIKNTAAAMIHKHGRGKVISFVDNLLFRGYWYGAHRLFANAMFYHELIDSGAMR